MFNKITKIRLDRDVLKNICSSLVSYSLPLIIVFLLFGVSTRISDYIFKTVIFIGTISYFSGEVKYNLLRSKIFKLTLFYLAYNFITVLYTHAYDIGVILKNVKYIVYLLGFVLTIFVYYDSFRNRSSRLLYLIPIASISAIYSVICFFVDDSTRLMNAFNPVNPIHDVTLYGFCCVFILALLSSGQNRICASLLLLNFVILVFTVFLGGSRSISGSLLISTIIYICFVKDKRIFLPLGILVGMFIIYQCLPVFIDDQIIKELIAYTASFIERHDGHRFMLWTHMLSEMSYSDWILGKGYYHNHSYVDVFGPTFMHPHSAFIFSLFHGGLILLIIHIKLVYLCLKIGLSEFKENSPYLLMIVGFSLLPQLTNGITIYDIGNRFSEMVIIFWLMLSVAIHKELQDPTYRAL